MRVITIDASQVTNALKAIEKSGNVTPQIIAATIDAEARQRLALLKSNTPYQERVDPRYPVHLRDSYRIRSVGGTRAIYINPISSAQKFTYVTEGTKSHNIFPREQKALWWPGIQGGRPVSAVYDHISKANPFHEKSDQQYNNSAISNQINAVAANGIANMITDTINSANAGGVSTTGKTGIGGIVNSMLGLVALLGMLASIGGAVVA